MKQKKDMKAAKQKELGQARKRIAELDRIFKRIYEDDIRFKRRLMSIMERKTPFAILGVRSGNCTSKQREVIENERRK